MECLICDANMTPFMVKDFKGEYGLREVTYIRCSSCGFVLSETHAAMSSTAWEQVNSTFHGDWQKTRYDAHDEVDPKWLHRIRQQADAMSKLKGLGLIHTEKPWLDYACGNGQLADLLEAAGTPTKKYDRYMDRPEYLGETELVPGGFHNVVNTCMFEHVTDLAPLDLIASLVADDGVLSMHTLVSDEISNDPSWYYLLPVHTAFFTNRSMDVLFARWGFASSIYCLPATMWFFLKSAKVTERAERLFAKGELGQSGEYHFKRGFVDYWRKGVNIKGWPPERLKTDS